MVLKEIADADGIEIDTTLFQVWIWLPYENGDMTYEKLRAKDYCPKVPQFVTPSPHPMALYCEKP